MQVDEIVWTLSENMTGDLIGSYAQLDIDHITYLTLNILKIDNILPLSVQL